MRRQKSTQFTLQDPEQSVTESRVLRSRYKQRSISSPIENNNQLDQPIEQPLKRSFQSTGEDSYHTPNEEIIENGSNKKYSSKVTERKPLKTSEEKVTVEKQLKDKSTTQLLSRFGLNPETLETTEVVTERAKFVTTSRITKSQKYSTEAIQDQLLTSSTLKPRYQLYQSKERKKLLEKRFGGSKNGQVNLEETEENKTGMNLINFVLLV